MNTRLFVCVLTVFTLVIGTVYAGGSAEEEVAADQVAIEVLNYGDLSTPEGATWVDLRDQFMEEHPQIVVDDDTFYDEVYHSRATAQLSAGDVPHVMYLWPTPRSSYAFESDIVVDLRDYVDLSGFSDSAMAPQGPDGEIYTIPLTTGINSVMYANGLLLDELGLSVPETYDELAAMVDPISDAGYIPVSMANADTWVMNSTLLGTLVGRFSGPGWFQQVVDGEARFTDNQFVTALEWIVRLYEDGVLPRDSVQTDYGTALAQFTGGRAVFMIDGHWRAETFAEAGDEFVEAVEWTVFPELGREVYPGSTAGGGVPGYALTTAAVEAEPEVLEASITFLEYITQEPGSRVRLENQPGFIPSYTAMDIDEAEFDPVTRQKAAFYDSVTEVVDTPDAFLPPDTNAVLNTGMQELALGVISPEELAERVQDELEREAVR